MRDDHPRLEPLQASLLKMLSTYSETPQLGLVREISRQFEAVATHPDSTELALSRKISARLQRDWDSKSDDGCPCVYTKTVH